MKDKEYKTPIDFWVKSKGHSDICLSDIFAPKLGKIQELLCLKSISNFSQCLCVEIFALIGHISCVIITDHSTIQR